MLEVNLASGRLGLIKGVELVIREIGGFLDDWIEKLIQYNLIFILIRIRDIWCGAAAHDLLGVVQRLTVLFDSGEFRRVLPESSDLFNLDRVPVDLKFGPYQPLSYLLLKEEHKAEVNLVAVRLVGSVGPVHLAELLEYILELLVFDVWWDVLEIDPFLVELRLVGLQLLAGEELANFYGPLLVIVGG